MFSLNYREMWSGAAGWLVEELDQIAASAQAQWNRQHTSTGTHSAVTAASVASSMVTHTDPLFYEIPESVSDNSLGTPIELRLPRRASVVMLSMENPGSGDPCHIKALVMPGAQIGDLVRIVVGLYSPPIYFHDSARPYDALAPPNWVDSLGNRLSLHLASTSAVTEGGDQYRRTSADGRRSYTFLRVDRADSLNESEPSYACWLEVD